MTAWVESARAQPGATLAAAWPVRMIVGLFAAGIPLDNLLVTRMGSSSVVLGVPLVLATMWAVLTTGRLRRAPAALVLLAAFTAWAGLSLLWVQDTAGGIRTARTYAQLLAFVWLSWQLLRTEQDVHAFLAGFLAGCAVNAAEAWRAFSSGESFGDTWESHARYAAEGYDPNDMAVMLAFGIPVAAYLAVSGGRRLSRLALAYLPLAASAIALSSSRGGTITAVVAAASVVPWVARRSRVMLVATLAAALVGVGVIAAHVPEDSWLRIFTIHEQVASGSIGERGELWRIGVEILGDHPVAGVGAGGYAWAAHPEVGILTVTHNTPLEVAVDFGMVGFLLFMGAVALLVRGTLRGPRAGRAFGLSLMLVWFVGTASLSWAARKGTWFVFIVCAALAALPRKPPAREP